MNVAVASYDTVICNSVLEHKPHYGPILEKLASCARSQVIVGFYRGLTDKSEDRIVPVETKSFWEPKYGYGTRDWKHSYLNTYSAAGLMEWCAHALPDWHVQITHLTNLALREFPRPAMVRLTRVPDTGDGGMA